MKRVSFLGNIKKTKKVPNRSIMQVWCRSPCTLVTFWSVNPPHGQLASVHSPKKETPHPFNLIFWKLRRNFLASVVQVKMTPVFSPFYLQEKPLKIHIFSEITQMNNRGISFFFFFWGGGGCSGLVVKSPPLHFIILLKEYGTVSMRNCPFKRCPIFKKHIPLFWPCDVK